MKQLSETSRIWSFFQKNTNSVNCKICKRNLKSFRYTKNLKTHLERIHPGVLRTEEVHPDDPPTSSQADGPSSSTRLDAKESNCNKATRQPSRSEVLSLHAKVAAISFYDKYPEYTNVARHFPCSVKYIKEIIDSRDEILEEWNKQTSEIPINEQQVVFVGQISPAQHRKITQYEMKILNREMDVWLRGCINDPTFVATDELLEAKAIELQRLYNLKNIVPDADWISSIREKYDLKNGEDPPSDAPEADTSPSQNKIRFDDRVKPKNILALNEKVAAIRRYEVDPVYKSVGRYFNCSPDQIKRIIMQKDEILNEWDNRTKKSQVNLTREMKTVKISFLGKAVHEWIRRMMYYSDFNLTDALIQTMAIEFKKALHLPNFFPDKSWVASFRNTYNLKEVSTKTLDIGCQEGLSVQIRDILSYLHSICGSSEGAPATAVSTRVSAGNHTEAATLSAEHKSHPRNAPDDAGYSCSSTPALGRRRNPIPAPSTKEAEPLRIKSEPAEEVVEVKMETVKMETDDNVITHEEAMHYVKQLEEFALLKENFRLIGLVERLEEALKEAS